MKRIRFTSPMSLRKLVLLSWALPGALVGCASILTFFTMAWIDHQSAANRVRDDLLSKSKLVARRLSAELLLGPNGAVDSVARTLEQELGLQAIEVRSGQLPCAPKASVPELCETNAPGALVIARSVELLKEPFYVSVSAPVSSFRSALNPVLFLWSAVPISFLLGLGLIFQRWLLKKYLVLPIGALVETSVHAKIPPETWPSELQELSRRLSDSFEDRDQAVFGRIAGGVIHDLKTLLQAIRIGQELAQESAEGSPKRLQRLETLLKTVSVNVPKMLRIIESTLDGSREIPVRKVEGDLAATIQAAVMSSQALADSRKVTLNWSDSSCPSIPHDPVQLERALTNLIQNGIEAFDTKGFDGRTPEVRISVSLREPGLVGLRIEDSGPGLPLGTDRAFRILRSTKPHGSGLGLTVTRKIIEAHGGSIEAGESQVLKGAAFHIDLPFAERGLA